MRPVHPFVWITVVATTLLVGACSKQSVSGATTGSQSSPPVIGPSVPASPTGSNIAFPTPTGGGFCVDRGYALDAAGLVRAGEEPWTQVAAFITAAEKIIEADTSSAPTQQAAGKVRQLGLMLHTMELSVRGSVENYPDDTSSQTWAHGLPGIVAKISKANGCPT